MQILVKNKKIARRRQQWWRQPLGDVAFPTQALVHLRIRIWKQGRKRRIDGLFPGSAQEPGQAPVGISRAIFSAAKVCWLWWWTNGEAIDEGLERWGNLWGNNEDGCKNDDSATMQMT